jgi:hypothetical protein
LQTLSHRVVRIWGVGLLISSSENFVMAKFSEGATFEVGVQRGLGQGTPEAERSSGILPCPVHILARGDEYTMNSRASQLRRILGLWGHSTSQSGARGYPQACPCGLRRDGRSRPRRSGRCLLPRLLPTEDPPPLVGLRRGERDTHQSTLKGG